MRANERRRFDWKWSPIVLVQWMATGIAFFSMCSTRIATCEPTVLFYTEPELPEIDDDKNYNLVSWRIFQTRVNMALTVVVMYE